MIPAMPNEDGHEPAATILIVEDQQDILENLSDYLELRGYQVMQAGNGKKAFEMALERPPDLIISDLGMPVWDGHRLLHEVQRNPDLARIPFIILTAWADRGNMRKGLQDGAVDYITKPFTLAEIDEAVTSHLGRKQRLDHAVQCYAMSEVIPSVLRYLPHELRTPMNGILAPSEMLMDMGPQDDVASAVQLGEIINLSALRLLRLVDNISLFLSLQTKYLPRESDTWTQAEFAKEHPGKLLEQVRGVVLKRYSFPETMLKTNGGISAGRVVSADFGKVFEEILDNACQFAASGTEVTLDWRDCGDRGTLTIVNQGAGMTMEQIQGVGSFKQFDREKREHQGLGLGLVLALQLARHHGGEMGIKSSPAGPTSISVEFPLNDADCGTSESSETSFVGHFGSRA